MTLEPALAERWEPLGEDGWRFHLRRGVTFHDGATFEADDVLFSYQRANSEQSDTRSWFAPVRARSKTFLLRLVRPSLPPPVQATVGEDGSAADPLARSGTSSGVRPLQTACRHRLPG